MDTNQYGRLRQPEARTSISYLADTAAEIDLHACEWKLPDSIEDEDITFAGNLLVLFLKETHEKQYEHLI